MTDKELITDFINNWPTPEPPVVVSTEAQLALVDICRKFEAFIEWAKTKIP